ncbi:MAG TPA: efflux RND transporter periplasmic adaptor subunit, partial [Mycobacterium sp.]|nr:efflux RND transporter periplasmic adaptor subunit [Mycobacterium sp.]
MKRIVLVGGLAALGLAGCKKAAQSPVYIAVPVERRNIVVAAAAAGPIQPILTVSVKSQASGAVTEMHVQTGDDVKPGQLLALIDPRLPKSALDQAQASVDQAQASFDYAKAQLAREDTLYKVQAVTQQEYQSTKVSYEQARAALINAQANLSDARIAYDQTRVTATLAGTIILKEVDIGTVISSPTHDVTGGTEMFQMANLDTVQVQAMVDETDVGKVQAGQPVTITVDAYPSRPFQGNVLKVEPKATVSQNVTQFPVDIDILNPGHLLKPGMNTEVEIHVGRRDSVLAIPTSALRTQKDVASAASVLGLDPNVVMQQLAAATPKPAPNTKGDTAASMGNSAGAGTGTMTMPDGRVVKLPQGVTAAQIQAIFTKMRSGGFGALTQDDQAVMMKLRQANGGGMGGGRGGRGGPGGPVGGPVGNGTQSNSYIVFALRKGQPTAVPIKTGLSDLDYVEIASGL